MSELDEQKTVSDWKRECKHCTYPFAIHRRDDECPIVEDMHVDSGKRGTRFEPVTE